MKLITYEEAHKLKLKKFFTNIPCRRGHICERYVANKACIECDNISRERNKEARKERGRRYKEKFLPRDNHVRVKRILIERTFEGYDDEILSIYEEAHRITKSTGIPMHVDHIVPISANKKVSGLHAPWKEDKGQYNYICLINA